MKTLLVGFLLCGLAWAQTSRPAAFIVRGQDEAPASLLQVRTLSKACPQLSIHDTFADYKINWDGTEYAVYRAATGILVKAGQAKTFNETANAVCKVVIADSKATATPSPQPASR